MLFIGDGEFAGFKQIMQSYKPNQLRAAIWRYHGKARKPGSRHPIHHLRKGSSGNATTGALAIISES